MKRHGRWMKRSWQHLLLPLLLIVPIEAAAGDLPNARPVPRLQLVPQPYEQVSFQREGVEIASYHFAPNLRRPFVFPVVGPSGRSLTRMGHPRDPESHSHHNSVWIAHNSVNGISFWDDRAAGRIVHQRIEKFEDEPDGRDVAAITSINHWVNEADGKVLLVERRRIAARLLPGGEWLLVMDLHLDAKDAPATLGKTPFGMVGVRMAKTIGVHDGGGTIRNSGGAVDEKDVLWKPARWVDYSGPIANKVVEGITLMDHPSNPNHPTVFHVRNDGWMGASLTFDAGRTIAPGEPLVLRYGLYVHGGFPVPAEIEKQWEAFARDER